MTEIAIFATVLRRERNPRASPPPFCELARYTEKRVQGSPIVVASDRAWRSRADFKYVEDLQRNQQGNCNYEAI